MSGPEPKWSPGPETADPCWKGLYRVGGITALILLLLPLAEIAIGLIPGVDQASGNTVTVLDWFTLFQNHWFLGLRNLGLLNLVAAALLVPTILAVYFALRRESEAYGTLGTILFLTGVAVYFANNKAFAMLSLSRQYASANSDAQRALLAAAGQAMLAEGENRAGLLLVEFACLVISAVMLRGQAFSRMTAYAGILGNALLMLVEILLVPVSSGVGMVVATCAGISIMTWYVLTGRRLLQLARL